MKIDIIFEKKATRNLGVNPKGLSQVKPIENPIRI